jgi:hypothetical protein
LCGGTDWHGLVQLVTVPLGAPHQILKAAMNGEGAAAVEGDDLNLLPVICGTCGYTVLFHFKTLQGGGWTEP